MLQVRPCFAQRRNAKELGRGTSAKTFHLRKDEPNPVPVLASLLEFGQHSRKHRFLGVNKSLETIRIRSVCHKVPNISFYSSWCSPQLTRKTCPSGWRRCISRTFQ